MSRASALLGGWCLGVALALASDDESNAMLQVGSNAKHMQAETQALTSRLVGKFQQHKLLISDGATDGQQEFLILNQAPVQVSEDKWAGCMTAFAVHCGQERPLKILAYDRESVQGAVVQGDGSCFEQGALDAACEDLETSVEVNHKLTISASWHQGASSDRLLNQEGSERASKILPRIAAMEGQAIDDVSASWGLDCIDDRSAVCDNYYHHTVLPWNGSGVTTYIVSTGINCASNAAQFGTAGRCVRGYDAFKSLEYKDCARAPVAEDDCALDTSGFGTYLAGLVGGNTYGVAKGTKVTAVKVLADESAGSAADAIEGLYWTMRQNLMNDRGGVVFLPITSQQAIPSIEAAVTDCIRSSMPVVVPAGDGAIDANLITPARMTDAFVVGGYWINPSSPYTTGGTSVHQVWESSNVGHTVDLFAPAKDIVSASLYGARERRSGTFAGAALAAGYMSMIRSRWPKLSPAQLSAYARCDATRGMLGGRTSGSPDLSLYVGFSGLIMDNNWVCRLAESGSTGWNGYNGDMNPNDVSTTTENIPEWNGPDEDAPSLQSNAQTLPEECFPGESLVEVQGKGPTLMSDLRAGDVVLTARAGYEPVLGFLHEVRNDAQSTYLTVVHTAGEFRASAKHIVFVQDGGKLSDKFVGDLREGDVLVTSDGESEVIAVRDTVGKNGMFAPLTASGTLVVDGVAASNYASYDGQFRLPHSTAHAILLPVRLTHKLGLSDAFSAISAHVSEKTDEAEILHPFLDAVKAPLVKVHQFLASSL